MLYFGNHYYPIGLSISDSILKLAQLKKTRGQIKIQALNQIDIPSGILEEGEIKNMDKFVSYLKDVGNNPWYGQIYSEKVIVSLPNTKTFVKQIKISKSLNDIKETVETEMEKHIPFLLDKIYYDWQIVDEEKDSYSVLVGACPQKISDDYYHALSQAGFSVEALESEAVAICRSLLEQGHSEHKKDIDSGYLIIDLGKDKTTFIVYVNKSIIFTTDIKQSQDDILEEIAKQLNVNKSKAEAIKKKYQKGDKTESNLKVDKIVNNVFWEVNKKINEIFGYYNNQVNPKNKIGYIKLSGEGASYKEIKSLISSSGVEIEIGNPLLHLSSIDQENISKKDKKTDKNKISHFYYSNFTASIGLSLNNLF